MKIAVTGHRPDKLGGYNENNPIAITLKQCMSHYLSTVSRDTIVISGMALGVDQWWAEAAIGWQIPFIAAVPFMGMESKWPRASQDRFNNILSYADSIVYVCEPGYEPWKMQKRNEWMVDNCDKLVAYWDGSPGGTANCVQYARAKGRTIDMYNPRTLTGETNGIR
jgi:uncharacterized phage-like protein YoqJ